jgi:hypothetical protein
MVTAPKKNLDQFPLSFPLSCGFSDDVNQCYYLAYTAIMCMLKHIATDIGTVKDITIREQFCMLNKSIFLQMQIRVVSIDIIRSSKYIC